MIFQETCCILLFVRVYHLCLPNEGECRSQILQLVLGVCKMQDLRDGCPILQVEDLVGEDQLPAVVLCLLEPLNELLSLLVLVGDDDLDWLEIFDVDIVVLVGLSSILEVLGESTLV